MKLTKTQLKQIIKEEIQSLNEAKGVGVEVTMHDAEEAAFIFDKYFNNTKSRRENSDFFVFKNSNDAEDFMEKLEDEYLEVTNAYQVRF